MRVLLDENVPLQLKALLQADLVDSINRIGWKQVSNGALLARMEGLYDVLITADQNLYAQQNLLGRRIAVIALASNRRSEVIALAPAIQQLLDKVQADQYVLIRRDGTIHTP